MMQIDKVKYDAKECKTIIHYQRESNKSEEMLDEYKIVSWDDPLVSFFNALKKLKGHVYAICEIEGDEDDLEIKGVSFSWTQGIMGATITACKTLKTSRSPLVLNTPHLPTEPYSEKDVDAPVLSRDCVDALQSLLAEAEKYINGQRQQKQIKLELTRSAA